MGDPRDFPDPAVPAGVGGELEVARRRWTALYDQVVVDYLSLGAVAAKVGALPAVLRASSSLAQIQAAIAELGELATSIRMVRVQLLAQASQRALAASMDTHQQCPGPRGS